MNPDQAPTWRPAILLLSLAAIIALLATAFAIWLQGGAFNIFYLLVPALLLAILCAAILLKGRRHSSGARQTAPYPPAPYGGMPPQPGAFPAYAPQPHAVPLAPPAPAAAEPPLQIDVDGVAIPLREGLRIDLGGEPALGGRGQGVRGDIVPHPRRPGVLGIRNAGESAWTAHLRDGRDQPIDKSQNVRLAPGVCIDFGDGLVGEVKARPA